MYLTYYIKADKGWHPQDSGVLYRYDVFGVHEVKLKDCVGKHFSRDDLGNTNKGFYLEFDSPTSCSNSHGNVIYDARDTEYDFFIDRDECVRVAKDFIIILIRKAQANIERMEGVLKQLDVDTH